MGKESNLRKFNEMDPEEHRRLSAKGGKAAGQTKRKRKALQKAVRDVLSMMLTSGEVKDVLELDSFEELDDANISVQDAMIRAMVIKALRGDVNAAYFLRDTAGDSPTAAETRAKTKLANAQAAKVKADMEREGLEGDSTDQVVIINDFENGQAE